MIQRVGLFLLLLSTSLFAIDFSQYHSEDDIYQYLRDVTAASPTMVKFHVLGQSDQGREVSYITLTKGTEALPAIFFNGTHHGNEWSATEGILGLIDYLLEHKDDADVSLLLTHYVFYLEPLVNPDGHHLQTREDSNGADPNRDYDYPGAQGTKFKTVIIKLMKQLLDSRKFRAAAAYHSGIEEVLWPWCYTSAPTPQKDIFYTFAKSAATAMGFDRYLQSYDDYETEGEFIDYVYMSQGTFGLTYEVSSDFTPPVAQLNGVVQNSIQGAMAFIKAVDAYDNGSLTLASSPEVSRSIPLRSPWDHLGTKLE